MKCTMKVIYRRTAIPYTSKHKRHNPENREFYKLSHKKWGERIEKLKEKIRCLDTKEDSVLTEEDFLSEIMRERTERNPEFPRLVEEEQKKLENERKIS